MMKTFRVKISILSILRMQRDYQKMELDKLESRIKELEFQYYLQTGKFPE